jgi:hypothetical protein
MMLEVLHRALVRFGSFSGSEGSEIAATPSFGVFLSGVQTVLPRFEFVS